MLCYWYFGWDCNVLIISSFSVRALSACNIASFGLQKGLYLVAKEAISYCERDYIAKQVNRCKDFLQTNRSGLSVSVWIEYCATCDGVCPGSARLQPA